jgi:tRNA threonylcarbamoyladenosine biosynthesis protein TsaB
MTATLSISTSTSQVSVAVSNSDGLLASFVANAGRRHGETLAPAIRAACDISGVEIAALDKVAVDVGPGLFTGLRVGVATAKALGQALGIPVAGASSLELLAFACRHSTCPVAAIVDARRGEVFWEIYQPVPGGVLSTRPPAVATPQALVEGLESAGGPLLAVGDGARRYAGEISALAGLVEIAPEAFDHPSASVLALLSERLEAVNPTGLVPRYLRAPDVRIGWETR